MRKQNIFSYAFVGGLLFLFPFLNIFRNFSTDENFKFEVDMAMFNEGHFDSYQNFLFVLSNDFVTYGRQLMGVIFFWLPRSVWPDKPVGSGFFLADQLHYSWENISMNFFAEGYINFGFLGVLLFIVIMAYITATADQIYWKIVQPNQNTFFSVIYTVSLGFLFFILRGDLMSSTAYLLGFLSSAIIVFKIAK